MKLSSTSKDNGATSSYGSRRIARITACIVTTVYVFYELEPNNKSLF
jgi:hypothetical protein